MNQFLPHNIDEDCTYEIFVSAFFFPVNTGGKTFCCALSGLNDPPRF